MDPAPASETGSFLDRLSEKQTAIFVLLAGVLLYVPFAGTYGMWDPWETHYAEVARQMTRRGDFISLWWPCSPRDVEVFWSKPVLSYWLMSIMMHIFRIGLPGGDPGEMALGQRAEWACRMPMCLAGALGMYALYLIASKFVSRRAGVLAALVVGTCPMYSLVARQAITDMPYVGPVTMALALVFCALHDDKDEILPRRGKGWLSWPHHGLFYGFVAFFALVVIPQLVVDSYQLKFEADLPFIRGRKVYGAIIMIPYYVGFVAALVLAAGTRYKAPLFLYLAAILCGLATLAKTFAPGLGLPLAILIAFLLATNSWKRFVRAQLIYALVVSVVIVVVVAVPWHHSMIVRHGWAFWNELFGDNNWRRMVLGRHGDRGTFEYFLRELGYSVLPWVAIAPAALGTAVLRRFGDARRQAVVWFGAIWFVGAYSAVSLSMTKFHHYVLPAIPGLALVIGCFLDDLVERRDRRMAFAAAVAGLPLLAYVTVDLVNAQNASQHFLWLFSYDYIHSPRGRPWHGSLEFRPALITFAALFAVGTVALVWRKRQRWAVAGLCLVAVAFTYFLLDVFMRRIAPFWSQKNVIATYYKERRSPDERLIAYTMYWRGETFYTKNEIYEGPSEDRTVFDQDGADDRLKEWVEKHRGRRLFFVYEKGRHSRLQSLLPVDARASFRAIDASNNKFSLAVAEL